MKGCLNMLYNNYTEELIGLQDIIVTNIDKNNEDIFINIELKKKPHICPVCGNVTSSVHDYRLQKIHDIPSFGANVFIMLRKRRYVCKKCKKRFFEENKWLPRYYRLTKRLVGYIIDRLSDVRSFVSVAKEVNLSVSTVIRMFDVVGVPKVRMPKVLSIDEFKGNTGSEKYQCIITDPENSNILDILPTRNKHDLICYFEKFDRSKTEFFISDMWRSYEDISKTLFKKSICIVDKYHFIRQVTWAFEKVRKEEQRRFAKTRRIYFKRSKRLLTKRFNKLNTDEMNQVFVMLDSSSKLKQAYWLKESFYDFLEAQDSKEAKKRLSDWVNTAGNSGIEAFEKCSNTMVNWSDGILNSFDFTYTNGFTEGVNNKIKVIKRNAYGYRNFERFRKRILHIFNYGKNQTFQA